MNTINNNADSQVKDVEALVRGSTLHAHDDLETPFVIVPPGYKLEDLEKLQEMPRRIRQTVKLDTVDSFITYVKDRKDHTSVMFANEAGRSLRAILDYHNADGRPRWCSHEVHYTAKLSREAQAWEKLNGKAQSQLEFAEFLEERIADVAEPVGASLLERALQLQVIQKAVIGSVLRLQSGEFQMNWSQENEKGTVELPEKIALGIPIFHGGASYRIEARLRFRTNEGRVSFTYKLVEWETAVEHAFSEVVKKVGALLTGVPIYQGGL